ncbi:MAG: Ig-like domain-containing protein [Bacillota bacterium]
MKQRIISLVVVFAFTLTFINIQTEVVVGATSNSNQITFKYDSFSDQSNIKLNGNATAVPAGANTSIMLTDAAYNQAGTMFYKNYINLSNERSFSTFFKFKISNIGGTTNGSNPTSGADGLTFILNNSTNSIGGTGGAMGYTGIKNSINVEFDTWDNSYDTNATIKFGDTNLGRSHIAVNVNGDPTNPVAGVTSAKSGNYDYRDGADYSVWIDFDGISKVFTVRVNRNSVVRPVTPVILIPNLNLNNILNDDMVYVGFTGATGGAYEKQMISSWYLHNDFNPTSIDTSTNTYTESVNITLNAVKNTQTNATITSTVRDNLGNPVANVPVTLKAQSHLGATYLLGTANTNSSGQVVTSFDGSNIPFGTYTFYASISSAYGGNSTTTQLTSFANASLLLGEGNVTTRKEITYPFLQTDFTKIYNTTLTKIKLISLPTTTMGTLKYNGNGMKVGDECTSANLYKITFVPDSNFVGTATFNFQANNGSSFSNTGTMKIKVLANNTPVSQNYSVLTNINTALVGNIGAFDADGDALTYSVETGPLHGTLNLTTGTNSWTYTPTKNYYGTDSFKLRVQDGFQAYVFSTTTVTVSNGQPPTIPNYNVVARQNGSLSSSVSGTDPNNYSLTYSKATDPLHGTLTVNANGSYLYTPTAGFFGTDTFSIKADNAHSGIAISTITATVQENSAPELSNYSFTTVKKIALNSAVSGADLNGDVLTYSKNSDPTHGSVTVNSNGTFVYTPSGSYQGADSFKITVSDAYGGSATATISVSVINTSPTVGNYQVSTFAGDQISGAVVGSDSNADSMTYSKDTNPVNGTATVSSNGNWSYTPNYGFAGSDSFKVLVDDNSGGTVKSTISINVSPDEDVVTVDYNVATYENTDISGTVVGTDANPLDIISYNVDTGGQPSHGTFSINSSSGYWTYSPNSTFVGTDSIIVAVNDNGVKASTSKITISVLHRAPVSQNYSVDTFQNKTLSGTVTATSYTNDTLTFNKNVSPLHGTATVNSNGSWSYEPELDYVGNDVFKVKIDDGRNGINYSYVNILISRCDDITTQDYSESTLEDQSISDRIFAVDANGHTVTFEKGSLPANGLLTVLSNGNWTYEPNSEFVGIDTFTILAKDIYGGSVYSKVTITVVNVAPTVPNYSVSAIVGKEVSGKIAGNHNHNSMLNYEIDTLPSDGTLNLSINGNWTYKSDYGFSGTDSFKVKVSDIHGGSAVSTVILNVSADEDVITQNYTVSVREHTLTSGTVVGTDATIEDIITYAIKTQPLHGSATLNSTSGEWEYTPEACYVGADSFVVSIRDNGVEAVTSTVIFGIRSNNPTVGDFSYSSLMDSVTTGTIIASDVDNDQLTFSKESDPLHGTAIVQTNGDFTYTPDEDYSGADSFVVLVTDEHGEVAYSNVSINISPDDDITVENYFVKTHQNTLVSGTVIGYDSKNESITYSKETNPDHGTASVSGNGDWSYTPMNGFVGEDDFVVLVEDEHGGKAYSTINISVENRAPTSQDYAFDIFQNQQLSDKIDANDPDNDALEYSTLVNPSHGQITVNSDGSWLYVPEENYIGLDSFEVVISDGKGGNAVSTSRIILHVNQVLSSDTHLSSLGLSAGILSPTFNSEEHSYITDVTYYDEKISFTPVSISSAATIYVNGVETTSGSLSSETNLTVGENIIEIVVVAENGARATYTVNINRTPMSSIDAVNETKDSVEIEYRGPDERTGKVVAQNLDTVVGDLMLPIEGVHGTDISWSSSDLTTINNNGSVIRPAWNTADKEVDMLATITKNGVTSTKNIKIKVLKMPEPIGIDFVNHSLSLSVPIGANGATDCVTDVNGNTYISLYNRNQIAMYDSQGVFVRAFGNESGNAGAGVGYFFKPNNMTIDDNDYIYVADSGNNRIVRFKDLNSNGVLNSNEWTVYGGTQGTGTLQFKTPKGVFVKNNKVYVADTFNSRVAYFEIADPSGTWKTFGTQGTGNGQFKAPMDINVDVTNNIWVSDTSNNRAQRFDSNGLFEISYPASLPYGIESDVNGNVYVAERMTGYIKCVNNIKAYAGTGNVEGKFTSPVGLYLDRNDKLWVVDITTGKMQTSLQILSEEAMVQAMSYYTGDYNALSQVTIGCSNSANLKNTGDSLYDNAMNVGSATTVIIKKSYLSSEVPVAISVVSPVTKNIVFSEIADGTYVVEMSRAGFITRYFTLVVAGENINVGDKPLVAGDLFVDGKVDGSDTEIILSSMGITFSDEGYATGKDFNCDGIVDGTDVEMLFLSMGKSTVTYGETVDYFS